MFINQNMQVTNLFCLKLDPRLFMYDEQRVFEFCKVFQNSARKDIGRDYELKLGTIPRH